MISKYIIPSSTSSMSGEKLCHVFTMANACGLEGGAEP